METHVHKKPVKKIVSNELNDRESTENVQLCLITDAMMHNV